MALIGSLTSGVSALSAFSKNIETIGDNIANANTTGFKSSRTRNEDSFSQTLENASGSGSSLQVGSGVNVATNRQKFTQGSLSSTGVATDIGIAGNGFFKVKNAVTNETFLTRDGNFKLDASGFLVNSQGLQVEGTAGAPIQLTNLVTNPLLSFSLADNGQITEFYSDSTSAMNNTINLWNFNDPTSLERVSGNLLRETPSAGVINPLGDAAGTLGLGTTKQGTLELSNVDLAQEFTDLITAQRSFQAGSRIITVSDSVLQEIVDLKR
jgi:flagellar hook protein FlgE